MAAEKNHAPLLEGAEAAAAFWHSAPPQLWVAVFVAASIVTHGFFAVVWTRPAWFRSFFEAHPNPAEAGGDAKKAAAAARTRKHEAAKLASSFMARISLLLRLVTAVGLIGTLWTSTPAIAWKSPVSLVGIVLAVGGQLLNLATYVSLGEYGIYYGRELGIVDLPLVTGFPFSTGIPDPQYAGVEISYIGLALISKSAPMVFLALFGALAYGFTAAVERYMPSGNADKKTS